MSRKSTAANELLDVFPTRPNQKVADKKDVLEVGRATRSSKNTSLFTFCPYLNKVVEYNGTPKTTKKRSTYSPEPQGSTPDVAPTRSRGRSSAPRRAASPSQATSPVVQAAPTRGRSLAPSGATSSRRAASPVVQGTSTPGTSSTPRNAPKKAPGAPTGVRKVSANDVLGATPTAPSTLMASPTVSSPEEDEEVSKRTTRSLAKADPGVVFQALKYTSSDASDSSSSSANTSSLVETPKTPTTSKDVRIHQDKKLKKEEIATPVAPKAANATRTIQDALDSLTATDAPKENLPETPTEATMDSRRSLKDAPTPNMALKNVFARNAPGSSQQGAQKNEDDGAPGPSAPLLRKPATESTPKSQKRVPIDELPEEPSPKKQARVRLWVPGESGTKKNNAPKKAASKKKVATPKPKKPRYVGFRKRDLQNPVFTYHPPEPTEEEEFVPKYARTDEEVRREVHLKMGILQ